MDGIWRLASSLVTENSYNLALIYLPFTHLLFPLSDPLPSHQYLVKGTEFYADYYVIFWKFLLLLLCSTKSGESFSRIFCFPIDFTKL